MEIITTEDGSHSLLSEKFGVSYHSKHGAIQESQHVFIEAGLHYRLRKETQLSILEIGFGTGLNAFMTYLDMKGKNTSILYTGVEAYPIGEEKAVLLNYPLLLDAENELEAFLKLHSCSANQLVAIQPGFSFCRSEQSFEEISEQLCYDVIYFDAFAPNAQPELWELPLLEKMYNALKPEGVLVTYCAKGAFKRNLKTVGFSVEGIPGPPGKREMTRAVKTIH